MTDRPTAVRYLPDFRHRPFYRATMVLLLLPVVVQGAFFVWLHNTLPHEQFRLMDIVFVPMLSMLAMVAAHLRVRSTLAKMEKLTRSLSTQLGPSKAVDDAILGLFRMPSKLLILEVPLSLMALIPLPILAASMDPRLVAPLATLPVCIMVMIIPPYLQSELWEIRRVVSFMVSPTEPSILEGHLRMGYLQGGILVLLPTALALFEVYELAHVLLLTHADTPLNIVRHFALSPVAACTVSIGALMVVTWWVGNRTGMELQTISRYFENVFRKPGKRVTGAYTLPEPGGFAVGEIHDLRNAAKTFADKLQQSRNTQLGAIESLEQAQRVKTVFLANMSHDLKSPLNSIIGFSELLLRGIEGDLNDGQKEDIRLIHASGEELLSLINNILDSARLESGKLELHKEWTPSVELISNVVKTGAQQIGNKHVNFEHEIQPGLPPVFVDPHRISQAIGNLISNAIKFMDEGTVMVHAYVHKTDDAPPRRFLRIDVEDTGQGIREEDRERIFEAFAQIDRSYSRRTSGMGLGLTLTKNLVDLHNGLLMLNSELGKGSTFSISLPLED